MSWFVYEVDADGNMTIGELTEFKTETAARRYVNRCRDDVMYAVEQSVDED